MAKKEGAQDYAAELKTLRRKRTALAAENEKREQKLQEEKAKVEEAQETERLKKAIEAERKRLNEEQRRASEIEGRPNWEAHAQPEEGKEQARMVELGHKQGTVSADADPIHNFMIVRRFFGVGEFRGVEKRKGDVVSKTKKLVGFK